MLTKFVQLLRCWIPFIYESIHRHSKSVLAGYSLVGNPTDFVHAGICANYVLRILFGHALKVRRRSSDLRHALF